MKRPLAIIALCICVIALADAQRSSFETPMRDAEAPFPAQATAYKRKALKMENLSRGVVAVLANTNGDVFVSWRYRHRDPRALAFNIYRNKVKLNSEPIRDVTWFLDKSAYTGERLGYEVRPVWNGKETAGTRGRWIVPQNATVGCFDIPLQEPPTSTLPDTGEEVAHHANDCSVGDVDGDGEYELVLKWESNAARDNLGGYTGETWFECLKIPSGRSLWKINMGINLCAGPHYQPFLVADFDCDGKAEMICRTAPGTVDGLGRVVQGNGTWIASKLAPPVKDYRERGQVFDAPEFLTVFNGLTGEAMDTVPYDPPYENYSVWGDSWKTRGNRSHRFLASTAYLDGVHPSALMCRGYYARSTIAAWDWDGKKLSKRWLFDSALPQWEGYSSQGFHNLRVCDVDFDGKDEIIYGAMVVDDDGRGLYTTGLGHGDQIHIVQSSPEHIGLQVWTCQENKRDGVVLRDARTGEFIFQQKSNADVPNCLAADVDPANPGTEYFAASALGIFDQEGKWLGTARQTKMYERTFRFAIWWTGTLERSLLAGSDGVWKYSLATRGTGLHTPFEDCVMNNGSKSNPCLAADILGDWREEVIMRRTDGAALRVYVSTFSTPYRFWTLMADPCYRNSVAAENAGYNVCPEPSFYFGPDLKGHDIFFRGCRLK